jgi:simple sugar transport system ATP-binding protein
MIPQRSRLESTLTVAENVVLGLDPAGRRHGRHLREVGTRLEQLGHRYGLEVDPEARVASLGVGERQRVEILRALCHDARVLLLDEPSSVLTGDESQRFLAVLMRLARDEHRGIVLVTHKIGELLGVADRVTVLRRGVRAATLSAPELSVPRLLQAMVGDGPPGSAGGGPPPGTPSAARPAGQSALVVRGLSVRPRGGDDLAGRTLRAVSFSVAAGEIFGIAGVEGNGQRELELTLVGLIRPTAGEVRVLARPNTVAYIPSEIDRWGVIRELTVRENLELRDVARGSAWRPWPPRRVGGVDPLREALQRFAVDPPDPTLPLRALSGGNVQKVLLARELGGQPALLVAAQPARGLDVAAAAGLRARLRDLARRGTAVVTISSDLDDLVGLCDRIAVLYRGQLAGVWEAPTARIADLAAAMAGVSRRP